MTKNDEMVNNERLNNVLAESECILEKINRRLDKINARQEQIEEKDKSLDGLLYFLEWKESKKKGVN